MGKLVNQLAGAAIAGLVACACASAANEGSGSPGSSSDAAPGAPRASELPLLDAVPENELPPGFDEKRGFAEYRLPDGHHVAVISAADPALDAAESDIAKQSQALTTTLAPSQDTWARRTAAGTTDFGRSCELRVNNIAAGGSELDMALLRFTIPASVTCGTIVSAKLTLKTAQNPATGSTLVVFPHRITQNWAAGITGLAGCASCSVASGAAAPFQLPASTLLNTGVSVNRPCTSYTWDVTPFVTGGGGWCALPAQNFGVMMGGRNGTAVVSFHSNEAPTAERPRLVIVF
jgi:hypothetical protein